MESVLFLSVILFVVLISVVNTVVWEKFGVKNFSLDAKYDKN